MRGFFFLKDTSKLVEGVVDNATVMLQKASDVPNADVYNYGESYEVKIDGESVDCLPFYGFVKCGKNYAGIRMLVDKLVEMAGVLNLSEGCCILEVELGMESLHGRFCAHREVSAEEFNDLFYNGDSNTLTVSVQVIPDNFITAIYTVYPTAPNVLCVNPVFGGEFDAASCKHMIYTDGCGTLRSPTDDGSYADCNELLDKAVGNHGQAIAYGNMSFGEIKNVCNDDVIADIKELLEKIGQENISDSTRLEDVIPDDMGSD